jgi:hypothetical protein
MEKEQLEDVKGILWDYLEYPQGSLWNVGTTPSRVDYAYWDGIKEVALTILSIIDRENLKKYRK